MIVEAELVAASTGNRAILQSTCAVYFNTYINFTITKSSSTSGNCLTCDGVTSVASASVPSQQFDQYLKDRTPPCTVHLRWPYLGTDMGPVSVGS